MIEPERDSREEGRPLYLDCKLFNINRILVSKNTRLEFFRGPSSQIGEPFLVPGIKGCDGCRSTGSAHLQDWDHWPVQDDMRECRGRFDLEK